MLGGYLKMWISFDREHCEMDGAPKVYPRAIDMTRRELLTHTAESCSSQTKRQRANAILIRGWMSSTHPEAPVIFSRPASIPGSTSNSSNLSWEIFRQNLTEWDSLWSRLMCFFFWRGGGGGEGGEGEERQNRENDTDAFRMLYYHDDNTQHQVSLYVDTNMQAQTAGICYNITFFCLCVWLFLKSET